MILMTWGGTASSSGTLASVRVDPAGGLKKRLSGLALKWSTRMSKFAIF